MSPRARFPVALAVAAVLAAGVSAAVAGDGDASSAGGTAETTSVETALLQLRSLYAAERESAVADLIAAGARARPLVLAAFRGGDSDTRPLLVRVLAADASKEALDALLAALPDVPDAGTSSAIQSSLVEHAERVADAVRSWHDASGKVPPRVAELAYLLDRARVETLFLAKKSSSGGTGSYPGQFDDLRPYRRLALDVCLGILVNRASKIPGRYPAGSYRFLRPPPFFVDQGELRAMATHAISELALPTDDDVVRELIALRAELEDVVEKARRESARGRLNAAFEAALSNGILATLAKLRPDDEVPDRGGASGLTWSAFADAKVDELQNRDGDLDEAAALALQLGRFEKAVELYRLLLRFRDQGAIAYYNLACAYSRWSLAPSEGWSPAALRALSIQAITRAVDKGYPDWSWMEEDGDLAPIRKEPRFREQIEKMKAAFAPKPSRPFKPSAPERPASPPVPSPATPERPR